MRLVAWQQEGKKLLPDMGSASLRCHRPVSSVAEAGHVQLARRQVFHARIYLAVVKGVSFHWGQLSRGQFLSGHASDASARYPWTSTKPGCCKSFEYVRKHGLQKCLGFACPQDGRFHTPHTHTHTDAHMLFTCHTKVPEKAQIVRHQLYVCRRTVRCLAQHMIVCTLCIFCLEWTMVGIADMATLRNSVSISLRAA